MAKKRRQKRTRLVKPKDDELSLLYAISQKLEESLDLRDVAGDILAQAALLAEPVLVALRDREGRLAGEERVAGVQRGGG